MREDDYNSTAERRRSFQPFVVRAVWFCLVLFCVGAMLACAAVVSFPRPGASEPLRGAAAFQEKCGIAVMQVTHYPFHRFDHFIGRGGTEVVVWIFWATVGYTPFALLRWPRWVFRSGPPIQAT